MMEGNLVQRVEPHYPEIAKQLNIQGPVVIKAVITREGLIEHQILESGQSLLAKAALDAVRQWHYRPYVLNGEPIAVETEITVNFILQQ
jgi:protein TonB